MAMFNYLEVYDITPHSGMRVVQEGDKVPYFMSVVCGGDITCIPSVSNKLTARL